MGRAGGLCALRLATSKLLANADRQADDGVSSRDLIDLAMETPKTVLWQKIRHLRRLILPDPKT
jgi:hypothetical protein